MFALLRKFARDKSGSPIMEAAVVFPFVLVLGLGAIEFGYALYQYQVVTSSLRTGARYLARVPFSQWDSPVPGDAGGFTYQQYAAALTVIDPVSSSPRVNGWSLADISITSSNIDNCTAVQGNCLQGLNGGGVIYSVQFSTSFTPEGLGFASLIGLSGGLQINASHEERVIGQ